MARPPDGNRAGDNAAETAWPPAFRVCWPASARPKLPRSWLSTSPSRPAPAGRNDRLAGSRRGQRSPGSWRGRLPDGYEASCSRRSARTSSRGRKRHRGGTDQRQGQDLGRYLRTWFSMEPSPPRKPSARARRSLPCPAPTGRGSRRSRPRSLSVEASSTNGSACERSRSRTDSSPARRRRSCSSSIGASPSRPSRRRGRSSAAWEGADAGAERRDACPSGADRPVRTGVVPRARNGGRAGLGAGDNLRRGGRARRQRSRSAPPCESSSPLPGE